MYFYGKYYNVEFTDLLNIKSNLKYKKIFILNKMLNHLYPDGININKEFNEKLYFLLSKNKDYASKHFYPFNYSLTDMSDNEVDFNGNIIDMSDNNISYNIISLPVKIKFSNSISCINVNNSVLFNKLEEICLFFEIKYNASTFHYFEKGKNVKKLLI